MQQPARDQKRSSVTFALGCMALSLMSCSGGRDASTTKEPIDAGRAPATVDASRDAADAQPNVLIPFSDAGRPTEPLVIAPSQRQLNIESLSPEPLAFSLQRVDGSAYDQPVRWTADRRDLGALDPDSGELKPSGVAGKITITALAGDQKLSVVIDISVRLKLEGDPDAGKLQDGAGGLGGVGGEGGGAALKAGPLRAALDAQPNDDAELEWLYPYDGTVWPRGLPAPLLQWRHGKHAPRAVKLKIEVDSAFSAELFLGPPPALPKDRPLVRLPIPQAVWRNALQSGQAMKVSLVVAAEADGGFKSYRAPSQLSWKIAPTTLKGVVYYNSYGTKLAENYDGAIGGNGRFGGATLAITGDAYDPKLVAGGNSSDDSGCRVCHTVSADGSRLISQRQDYANSSLYDLRNANQETPYPAADSKKFGWAALSSDGQVALGSAGPPGTATATNSSLPTSALYKVTDGTPLTANGLAEVVTQAATPAFSLDMTKLVFNLFQGPAGSGLTTGGRSLVVMNVKKVDDTTYQFDGAKAVFTASGAKQKPAWPFFLPDNSGVVFQLELNDSKFCTWKGARGELWWTDLEGRAHALERANGQGYLPTNASGHDADSTLQYEPTVAPIVAGGYAWVVFTSRRLYGNVATRAPFESDPRVADISPGNAAGPTTKKLWVSALRMPPEPGTDPSHPAFYLPAQELYAGNSRGFWALEACKEDRGQCTGGDECCGGYCQLDSELGGGTCTSTPPDTCKNEYDKCNASADCCAAATPLTCVAGRCAVLGLD